MNHELIDELLRSLNKENLINLIKAMDYKLINLFQKGTDGRRVFDKPMSNEARSILVDLVTVSQTELDRVKLIKALAHNKLQIKVDKAKSTKALTLDEPRPKIIPLEQHKDMITASFVSRSTLVALHLDIFRGIASAVIRDMTRKHLITVLCRKNFPRCRFILECSGMKYTFNERSYLLASA